MQILSFLNSLLGLATSGVVLAAGVLGLRTLGGTGAWLMIIGAGASLFSGLVWVVSAIDGDLLSELLDRQAVDIFLFYQAMSLFHGGAWTVAALGMLLEVLMFRAALARSDALSEIRREQGLG